MSAIDGDKDVKEDSWLVKIVVVAALIIFWVIMYKDHGFPTLGASHGDVWQRR